MVKEIYIIKIVKLNMKEILLMIKLKEMEDMSMKMVINILDNLKMGKEMVMEYYLIKMVML